MCPHSLARANNSYFVGVLQGCCGCLCYCVVYASTYSHRGDLNLCATPGAQVYAASVATNTAMVVARRLEWCGAVDAVW